MGEKGRGDIERCGEREIYGSERERWGKGEREIERGGMEGDIERGGR